MLMQMGVKPDALTLLFASNFAAAIRLATLLLNRPTTPSLSMRSTRARGDGPQLSKSDKSSVPSLAQVLSS
jgi:hypothetical protein